MSRPPVRRYDPTASVSAYGADSGGGGSGGGAAPAVRAAVLQRRHSDSSVVRFNRETRVYLVDAHWEWPESDQRNVWYSQTELASLGRDVKKTVKHMRRRARDVSAAAAGSGSRAGSAGGGRSVSGGGEEGAEALCDHNGGVCARGLEHLQSSAHMEQRKINRDCAQKAVFDEQTRQREENARDEEELRRASLFGSAWSRNNARLAARGDERAAREFLAGAAASASAAADAARRRRTAPPAHPAAARVSTRSLSKASEEILREAFELCEVHGLGCCQGDDCRRASSAGAKARAGSRLSRRQRSRSTSPLRALPLVQTRAASARSSAGKTEKPLHKRSFSLPGAPWADQDKDKKAPPSEMTLKKADGGGAEVVEGKGGRVRVGGAGGLFAMMGSNNSGGRNSWNLQMQG